ncbi:MAG: ATP-dependent Clp protease adapter ClpS [Treponema sp.]|jgi:ATP-dependent Clp protease adaptor protein ClpS|nr:ATP-dependent Clp protease adapter ClpS [Treponema sp.]
MSKENNTGLNTAEKIADKLKEPEDYHVILLNDDFTSMDFVVEILMDVFHKSMEDAANIMLHVHKQGKGIAGMYPWDIAITKVDQVHNIARMNEFPLKCIIEKA